MSGERFLRIIGEPSLSLVVERSAGGRRLVPVSAEWMVWQGSHVFSAPPFCVITEPLLEVLGSRDEVPAVRLPSWASEQFMTEVTEDPPELWVMAEFGASGTDDVAVDGSGDLVVVAHLLDGVDGLLGIAQIQDWQRVKARPEFFQQWLDSRGS